MRLFLYALLAITVTSCVSAKKYREQGEVFAAERADSQAAQQLRQDSMLRMRLDLERIRGGNESLLAIHERVQDRLAQKERELDELRGNLNSTSSQLGNRIQGLEDQTAAAEAAYDSLLQQQGRIITGFQRGVRKALKVLTDSLDGKIPDESFTIADAPGEVILSIQEAVLFRPRSVDRLTDVSTVVLRAIMDALQSDPLLKLTIIGHTDNQPATRRGTDNRAYAALRAAHLAEELATNYYLSPNRVLAASYGEAVPLRSNATDQGRQANRRIDFVLRNNVGNLVRELGRLGKR